MPIKGACPLKHAARTGLALALLAAAAALAAGWHWRAEKLALLQPAPGVLQPRPDSGNAAGGVLLFGDSRIAQWHPLPQRPYPVIRHGHSGESAIRLAPTFEAALDRHKPRLAMVQLGGNDAFAASLATPAVRTQALEDSAAAFARMAAAAQARSVTLVIMQPLPPIRPSLPRRLLTRGHDVKFTHDLAAKLPQIADTYGAGLADPLALLGPSAEQVPDAYRRDSLHLTPEAYARLDALLPATLSPAAPPPRN